MPANSTPNTIIEFKSVSKSFGSNKANDEVSFKVHQNEIHALLGENGAGKSTIMSILFGLYARDSGDVIVSGNIVNYRSAKDANADGIAMLPQHFKLIDNMTVLENVTLGKEEHKMFFLDNRTAKCRLLKIMEDYNLPLDPEAMVDTLSVSEKQRVEMLKILWTNADIMILDEPTSILTPNEIENFLKLVLDFKRMGKTVIIITHKLDEVKKVADRCTIMRKGKTVGSHYVAGMTEVEMAHMMVGRSVDLQLSSIRRARTPMDRIALSVENLFLKQRISQKPLNGIDLDIRAGEILGIAAVEGNGQSELFKIIGGLMGPDAGEIYINDQKVTDWPIKKRYSSQRLPADEVMSLKTQISELRTTLKTVEKEEAATGEIFTREGGSRSGAIRRQISHFKLLAKRKRAFLSHIPEDRHEHGLILDFSCADNAVLQDIDNYGKYGFYIRSDAIAKLDYLIRNYDIRGVENANTLARALSGGNQQKLILGREIERQASVLLAYNPTRGLDVGSIRRVYEQLIKQRDNGAAILLYSGELDEVLDIADRVAIMHNGIFVGVFEARDISRDEAGLAMFTGTLPEFTTQRSPIKYIGEQTEGEASSPVAFIDADPMSFVTSPPSFYPLLPEHVLNTFGGDQQKVVAGEAVSHKVDEFQQVTSSEVSTIVRPRTYVAKKRKQRVKKTVPAPRKPKFKQPVKVIAFKKVPKKSKKKNSRKKTISKSPSYVVRKTTSSLAPVRVTRPKAYVKKRTYPVVSKPKAVAPSPRSAFRSADGASVHKTTVVRTVRTTVIKTVSNQKGANKKKTPIPQKQRLAKSPTPIKTKKIPKLGKTNIRTNKPKFKSKARGR